MSQQNPSALSGPDPQGNGVPKGAGVNKKVLLFSFGGLLIIIIAIALAIVHYRGHHKTSDQEDTVRQQQGISASSAIAHVQPHYGALAQPRVIPAQHALSNAPQIQHAVLQAPQTSPVVDSELRSALRSSTSVINNYQMHADQRQVSTHSVSSNLAGFDPSIKIPDPTTNHNYETQNMQKEKAAFLKAASKNRGDHMISSTLTQPISRYQAMAGTIIPASLMTGINSDLPGQIIATTSRNIYDTTTGNYLLIPQGTKVIGAYDSQVAYGQSRVLIAWSRLIFPNGTSFDLQGMPGADLSGMAGLHDLVNNHYLRIFGSALMFSMFGAAGQLSQPQSNNGVLTNQQIIYGAIGQQMSNTGAQLVQKNMNIQPTIEIRPWANFNILLTRDMVLPGPYQP